MSRELPAVIPDGNAYVGCLTLGIQKYELVHDGSQKIRVAGAYLDETVGFELTFGPEWGADPLTSAFPFGIVLGTVMLGSIGAPSDAFVQLLGCLYRAESQPARMRNSVRFIGIALDGNPAHLQAGPARVKLTHEEAADVPYFDLIVVVDLPNERVQLREKDDGFRKAVLQGLAVSVT